MSITIRATTSEQLAAINDVIHDSYSEQERHLRVRFSRPPLVEYRDKAAGICPHKTNLRR